VRAAVAVTKRRKTKRKIKRTRNPRRIRRKRKTKKVKKKDKKDKKDKKKKKDKKDKKDKKAKKLKKKGVVLDAVSNQFGKYGVLKQEDFFMKKPEFICWAMEVKNTNVDALGQMQMKDLFKDYVEDFNTATMPSEKYYDLNAWDKKVSSKRQKNTKGDEMTADQKASLASFDDEGARKSEIKHLQAKRQEQSINDEFMRLRADREKVSEMRHQDQMKAHMNMAYRQGHTEVADKLKGRMDPSKDEFGRPKRRAGGGEPPL